MDLRPRDWLLGAGVGLGTTLLLGVVTGLIPNSIYVRMVPRRPADYVFLLATGAFAGAFVVQQRRVSEPLGDRYAAGGVVGGLLAFGCPVCNVVLVSLVGSSTLMTYFEPLRPLLGVLSVGLFAGLLYYQHRRNCVECAN
ncbi:hypothetical protein ACKVMT_17940 [Halobacteriales archaeon Cl-PHB]